MTAYDLCELFKNVCSENNLKWKKWLIVQSYDGAAYMSRQYNELQSLIRLKILQQNLFGVGAIE